MSLEVILFNGTTERERIKGLWKILEALRVWGPGVATVKNMKRDLLLEMLDLVGRL